MNQQNCSINTCIEHIHRILTDSFACSGNHRTNECDQKVNTSNWNRVFGQRGLSRIRPNKLLKLIAKRQLSPEHLNLLKIFAFLKHRKSRSYIPLLYQIPTFNCFWKLFFLCDYIELQFELWNTNYCFGDSIVIPHDNELAKKILFAAWTPYSVAT